MVGATTKDERMKKILAAVSLLVPLAASAERADALKPVNIQYDKANVDQVGQSYIATGNVIITRGTMVLKSDRAEVKASPDGYHIFVLTAEPDKLATFRQKRDGGADLWEEGHAQRIEYDERNDLLTLISKAMIRQLEGAKVTQEMTNEFISYDNRQGGLLGRNDASGADRPGNGRGSMTPQPHQTPTPDASWAGKQ
jgi:lipopolysaccharide export system protein LptA